jgi:succinate dehydrogenase/fumarate reductase flavoprotein subunit
MDEIRVAPPVRAQVVVIGGGIAGTWTALKLARAGIHTLLIDYAATDRGGVLGSTARSVGAVNTSPMDRPDFREFMDELGQGQVHPSTVDLLLKYLPEELAELQGFGEFKRIKLGVALANGNAGGLLRKLQAQFRADGGQILDAWVTRLVADETSCQGVQYQRGDTIGKVSAQAIVLACGGYAGLFDGSVKTNNHGTMLGRYLQAGGLGTNLEFIFKHGYGKPDLGALTPTEELPGAEVYDDSRVHVEWLERELYEGRGTANHLEAFRHWRNNKHRDFFIDLKYRDLYAKVQALNAACRGAPAGPGTASVEASLQALTTLCPEAKRHDLEGILRGWVQAGERIDFERFGKLKPFFESVTSGEVFRVRQIAYFSMGGAAHVNCETNLTNVFVNGEAMHDFGAHRVGGLPWGLYLAAGRLICARIGELLRATDAPGSEDFELVRVRSQFDPELLQEIREKMHRFQERDLNIVDATKFISWLRAKRRLMIQAHRTLDDAVAWTVVAEAVMQSSLRRAESRGCFYRSDHPVSLEQMKRRFSCVNYNVQADVVPAARLIRIAELPGVLLESPAGNQRLAAVG